MSTATTLTTPRRASGPTAWPPLGVLPAVRRDALGFLMETFRQHGDVAGYWLGPLRSHLVSHPDGVQRVLQERARIYTKDHLSYSMVRWVVGDGLLTSQGETWLRQRRLAQPAFHRQRLAALADLMVARTEAMLDAPKSASQNSITPPGGSPPAAPRPGRRSHRWRPPRRRWPRERAWAS
jgi:cytochrome P450